MGAWVVTENITPSWEASGLVSSATDWQSNRCMGIEDSWPDDCDYYVDGESCDGHIFEDGDILWHECCNTCLAAEIASGRKGPSPGRCSDIGD
jgi:hypothetical protein